MSTYRQGGCVASFTLAPVHFWSIQILDETIPKMRERGPLPLLLERAKIAIEYLYLSLVDDFVYDIDVLLGHLIPMVEFAQKNNLGQLVVPLEEVIRMCMDMRD